MYIERIYMRLEVVVQAFNKSSKERKYTEGGKNFKKLMIQNFLVLTLWLVCQTG